MQVVIAYIGKKGTKLPIFQDSSGLKSSLKLEFKKSSFVSQRFVMSFLHILCRTMYNIDPSVLEISGWDSYSGCNVLLLLAT